MPWISTICWVKTVELFEANADVLEYYQDEIPVYIMVDEYPDTNLAQFKLCRSAGKEGARNICVVGDDDQSIYNSAGQISKIF